jgi:hypothetical protein
MSLQHKATIPRCAVLRGENEADMAKHCRYDVATVNIST